VKDDVVQPAARQDEVRPVVTPSYRPAEHACLAAPPPRGPDVPETPGTEELFHGGGSCRVAEPLRSRRSGLGPLRGEGGRRSGGRLSRAVDQLLQLLAGLEVGDPLGRDVDLVSGLGIAPLARAALPDPEAAEATELDLLILAQRLD